MLSRFAVAVPLAISVMFGTSYCQESAEVVLGSTKDSLSPMACGADGRVYFARSNRDLSSGGITSHSVFEVSRDGSIFAFQAPDSDTPVAAAFEGSGGSVLMASPRHGNEVQHYEMYRLDHEARLLGRSPVPLDFYPIRMAVLTSGKTIVLGHDGKPLSWAHRKEWTYVGAVLDADGGVIERFDFPSPESGGKWIVPSRHQMMAAGGAANVVLETDSESAIGIATISETGRVDIKVIPEPPDDDIRIHRAWLLGPGVAVEEYTDKSDRPRFKMHYDEYDLNSGEKIASKISLAGSTECYFGSEVGWTTNSTHVEPARLSPDTLRLIYSKLESPAATAPRAQH